MIIKSYIKMMKKTLNYIKIVLLNAFHENEYS